MAKSRTAKTAELPQVGMQITAFVSEDPRLGMVTGYVQDRFRHDKPPAIRITPTERDESLLNSAYAVQQGHLFMLCPGLHLEDVIEAEKVMQPTKAIRAVKKPKPKTIKKGKKR